MGASPRRDPAHLSNLTKKENPAMGSVAAGKIKDKADALEKALNQDKAKLAKEEDAAKKAALMKSIQEDTAFLVGWREAQRAAEGGAPGQETRGISRIMADEQKIVDADSTARDAAKARGDGGETTRLQRKIDLESTTIAGKKAALDLIV
jgi:hypothetical protein